MAWAEFGTALVIFLLSHSLPVRPPVRPWLVERLGRRGFTIAYSIVSLAILGWMIHAAAGAPYIPLWYWAPWQNHVVLAAMLPVCLIVALAIGKPNPFSFGGAQNDRFDPAHPGVVGWLRHPFLIALALWSGAHLIANGDLAHVILFGMFAVFAVIGHPLLDRRKMRTLGARWAELRAQMSMHNRPSPRQLLIHERVRVAAGLALYAALIGLHPYLFGVSPLN